MFYAIDLFLFVMWFGTWSSSHGWGAVGTAIVWTVFSLVCMCCEFWGTARRFERSERSEQKEKYTGIVSLAGIAMWILYFLGLGDWIRIFLPKSFPAGGALFNLACVGAVQFAALILWGVVRFRHLAFIARHAESITQTSQKYTGNKPA